MGKAMNLKCRKANVRDIRSEKAVIKLNSLIAKEKNLSFVKNSTPLNIIV